MMNKFIPLGKRSKREQKKFYSMQRLDWNGFNPTRRITPNGKGYDRNKIKDEERKRNNRSYKNEPVVLHYQRISEKNIVVPEFLCPITI